MSSRKEKNKRKASPKKIEEKPGNSQDEVENEEQVNEDDIYNSGEVENSSSSSEEEDLPPNRKVKSSKKEMEHSKPLGRKKSTVVSEDGDRVFKILVESIIPKEDTPYSTDKLLKSNGGKYTGKNPMQAAKKAFNRICRSSECTCYCSEKCNCNKNTCKCASNKGCKCTYRGSCTYIFNIQETTPNSAKKTFSYCGERTRLDKPQVVPRGNIEYFVHYISHVKSYKPDGSGKKAPKDKPSSSVKKSSEKVSVGRPPKNKDVKSVATKKTSPVKQEPEKRKVSPKAEENSKQKDIKKSAPRGRKTQQKAKV